MGLRAAADGGRGDGVGVPEVDLGRRHRLALLHLHQGHPVLPPDLSEGVTLGEPGAQAIAIAAQCLRAEGVQRDQDVVISTSEAADPVLGGAGTDVPDQLRPLRGPFDERPEGPERQLWDAPLEPKRDESGPRDADVEAVVRAAAGRIAEVVEGPWREPYVPVSSGGDLRGVGLVAADEPSQLSARLRRRADRQQEVPRKGHHVGAEDEPLDVREVERQPVPGQRSARTRVFPVP